MNNIYDFLLPFMYGESLKERILLLEQDFFRLKSGLGGNM